MEYLEVAIPVLAAVIPALIAYMVNQRQERIKRSEQYQLEQIEKILRTIVKNAETANLPNDHPDRSAVLLTTKEDLAVLRIYGSDRVLNVLDESESPNTAHLVNALQKQGRSLVRPRALLSFKKTKR